MSRALERTPGPIQRPKHTEPLPKRPFYRRDPLTVIILTIALIIFSQVAAAILISIYPAYRSWNDEQATAWLNDSVGAQAAFVTLSFGFVIYGVHVLLGRAKVTWRRIGMQQPRLKDAGLAAVTYGLYFMTYLVIVVLAANLIPSFNADQEQQIGFDAAYGSWQLFLSFFSLVILPPLAEEILFRGYLFTALRARLRLRYTIVLTSLLFGAAHLQFGAGAPLLWVAALDTFVLSAYLCYIRERSGSLWPPIFLHAIKNGVAFVILFGGRF